MLTEQLKDISLRVASEMPNGFLWTEGCNHESGIVYEEVIDFAERFLAALPKPEPVYQFRKSGCSDWHYGLPDNEDGSGPYETRVLYAEAPIHSAQPASEQKPVAWMRPDCETSFITDRRKIADEYQADHLYSIPLYTATPDTTDKVAVLVEALDKVRHTLPHIGANELSIHTLLNDIDAALAAVKEQ